MSAFQLDLHPAQMEIFQAKPRFVVTAAGRRFGKTRLAIAKMIVWAVQNKTKKRDIFYIAPTYQQAKDIVWNELKDLAGSLLASVHENTGVATLLNGVRIHLKGSDRPDTLRGVGLIGVVIDEYADMKPNVWEEIISPALADTQGPAFFIGTPKGRNHFYVLAQDAQKPENKTEWVYFHFTTYDNPHIPIAEIESAKKRMSKQAFRQEFLASFEAGGSDIFQIEELKVVPLLPPVGTDVVTVDLAGFAEAAAAAKTKNKRLDDSVICSTRLHTGGWYVRDMLGGRWTVDKTAEHIVLTAKAISAQNVGIEKGLAQQAVMQPLREYMARHGYYFTIHLLTHGNKNKIDRITWALQARLEHGRIQFAPGDYLKDLKDQLTQFPDPLSHDDYVDALAYTGQLADLEVVASSEDGYEDYQPLDPLSGY